jgi:hypothetical protein
VGEGLEGCACKSREVDCGLHVHHLGDGRDPSFGRVKLEYLLAGVCRVT